MGTPDEHVAEFVRGKISDVVEHPAVAEKLKPRGYPIVARRPTGRSAAPHS